REPTEKETVTLEFLTEDGKLLRKISNKPEEGDEPAAPGGDEEGGFGRGGARTIPAKTGLDRFAWDLRYAEASRFKGMSLSAGWPARTRPRRIRLRRCIRTSPERSTPSWRASRTRWPRTWRTSTGWCARRKSPRWW